MSDLKQIAEACLAYWADEYPERTDYPDRYIDINHWDSPPEFAFYRAANPTAVLELIRELETITADRDAEKRMKAQARIQRDVIRGLAVKRAKYIDHFRAENERLRAEVKALKVDLGRQTGPAQAT